jgi:uncharacterized protein
MPPKPYRRGCQNFSAILSLAWTLILSSETLAAALRPMKPAVPDKGALAVHSCEGASFKFDGVLGRRIDANVKEWLLPAPRANPGMLEMFRVRDREPVPKLVPWAGEFVGKYLISAIQALRMAETPELRDQVRAMIAELIATQADDGYLGPFTKATRLKGNWDLWGHYHCLQALMMWHQATGDAASLAACRRAADLVCNTFLDAPRRVFDAGSHEMNMAILHGLGELHRMTGEPRYLRMMREIEKDWERAGDYFRAGLSGLEFFQSPRPRWESLHDLQGLVELYRITGDARYRAAFEHHWRSIARWDRHNTGGFSSGEQATGNPYSPGAIETCCTIAWMALTVDMLRLTGDSSCADELELSTFNGGVGAQHPSGRWWTYSTPMDGVREASAHSIVFQSRAGTPELNCCSVNAPRALGMLSEWAVMADAEGLVINHYGPGNFRGKLADQTPVTLRCETEYPVAGQVRLRVDPGKATEFLLKFRIPAWSGTTRVEVNGKALDGVTPGRYLEVKRRWRKGDTVELGLDMTPRFVTGDREAAGKVSIYRGPLLLTYDQRFNSFDEAKIPLIDLPRISEATILASPAKKVDSTLSPWLLVNLVTEAGPLHLCDFASAGAAGTTYRSWLAARNCPPPPVVTRSPVDRGAIAPGAALFQWTGPRRTNALMSGYQLVFSETADFNKVVARTNGLRRNRAVLDEGFMRQFTPGRRYYWKVATQNAHGKTESVLPVTSFSIDQSLPALAASSFGSPEDPDGLLLKASLRGEARPEFGQSKRATPFKSIVAREGETPSAVELDGKSQMLTYTLEEFPEEDYTVSVRVRFAELPANHLGQIFSAWCAPSDDPLRLCVENGKLFARVEAGQAYSTSGVAVETGRWYHVAAIKAGTQLGLFVDGKRAATATVPMFIRSNARDFALGGNPHYTGNEFLAGQFSDLTVYARAVGLEELGVAAAPR